MVLDHLAEMSGNLRQWDMEKDVQTTLANEVRKLKEQLKIAEERLQQQRDRVNSMGPKVSTARQKINAGRRECFKLSRICSTLGNRLMGKNYKYASIRATDACGIFNITYNLDYCILYANKEI